MNQRAGREGTGKVSSLTLLCQDARRLVEPSAPKAHSEARPPVQQNRARTLRGRGQRDECNDPRKGNRDKSARRHHLRQP